MSIRLTFFLLGVSTFFSVYSQDQCEDIIKQGLFDKLNLDRNNSFEESFDKYIESSKFNEFVNNDEFGFDVGIPIKLGKLGFGMNSNDMTVKKFQDVYKDKVSIDNKAIIREYLKQEIASKVLTEAWSKCMGEDNKAGLVYKVDYSDKSLIVVVRLRWVPRFNVVKARLIDDISVINGERSSNCLEKESVIGTEWISCLFKRDNLSKDLFITIPLANNLGVTTIKVDGKLEEKKSVADKCFEGEMDSCSKMLQMSSANLKELSQAQAGELKECELINDNYQKSKCFNDAAFKVDKAFSNHALLQQLVQKIAEVSGICAIGMESENCTKQKKLLRAQIFNFVNETPASENEKIGFSFEKTE